ncbi:MULTISPECIES: bifunctional GNAT family N-acetyltransferase/acetate--CoA ligase family protein [unclassified Streptomyces]|uniref:bifunctional acetate--CoA ligase family protein/GNAT family N-acetyltransferase n=1 Tax=unclassified Streptomyces TaxID=2593676 RepID=UPI002255AA70|nr:MULTISPECIES: bifunctional GNAT family N-acetyltransferase/acetate--CoA ligase family protein [unclassified Streptomyces]MCX5143427.1 GNAT family N-acetyltransferase [Streptomyces sp. NBC_00338]WRZ67843.1 GNAT family N-acetyltransferase [Streptomyces sp. NBC_01257]WSU61830.1 GNAT family N-acetyltransferase [Streptomyces sp. NBC_01104]
MQPSPEQSPHHAYPDHWEADVVLRDGGTARIRPITTDDAERLVSFYEQVSDESKYYRFFAPYPRLSAKDVHRFTHHDYVDRVGLAVTVGGEFIATVRFDRINAQGRPASAPADEAEVAFLVQDAHQGRGVASTLLEHIAAVARERGIRRFAAEVLPANNKMIKVFRDAGYTQQRSFEDGAVHLTLDLEPTAESLAVQRAREQRAEARSVQRLLAPGSVAVIGAGRTPGGVGRTVLRNLLGAGFTGRVYAVNSALAADQDTIDGVPAHRSLGEIGEPVDLAVVAVPADRVPEAVADCGEHGVQGLVVLSAGYAEWGAEGRERQRELVRQARSYGMRIIGPNAFGIINNSDAVRLNASLAPERPASGRIGLFTQSGAIGIALLSGLYRRGAGLSTFISAGNRADISGNDFLQYWYEDPDTDVALLYLESLGNPRKFTRLARRTAAVKPVVVVKGARHSGSTPPGHAVPVSRIPDATVSALMRQAGVIRVDTVTEMVDAGLLLAGQPLPAGGRVAILGNSESLGLLTYDACLAEGLRPRPPVDLTTAATPQDFRDALAEALADGGCDAVIVTAIPWVGEDGEAETGDGEVLATALRAAAATGPAKPVAVVHVEIGGLAEALAAATSTVAQQRPAAAPLASRPAPPTAPAATAPAPDDSAATDPEAPRVPGRIPAYPAAERAVRALAEAVKYAQWRRQAAVPGKVPEFLDDTIDEPAAAALIDTLLGRDPDPRGRPLEHDEARELLACYGIAVRPTLPAPGPEEAVAAAGRLGYPVALKTTAPHLRHRADLGGVRLDLGGESALRRAYGELTGLLGKPAELRPVVQAMAPRGVDTVVRATIDPAAGAVLSFGLAGAPSELLGDTAHRLVPATDRDAAELIRSIRAAPVLFGWRGSAPVDTAALEELLLRVSRLVDDHPEVVSIALEPVVVATQGLTVLGASVRLSPPPARTDLGPRRLSNY